MSDADDTHPLPVFRAAYQAIDVLQPPAPSPAMVAESRTPTPILFELDLIERVRDLSEERFAATGSADWSALTEFTEDVIAGRRDESEIGQWIEQYQIEEELGLPPRRTP